MRKKYKKRSLSKGEILVLALTVIFVLTAITGGIWAKYTSKFSAGDGFTITPFYFESDYLTEEGAEYTVYDDSVVFNLYNHDGLNYMTKSNVRYSISADSGTLSPTSVTYKDGTDIPQLNVGEKRTHTYTLTKGASSTVTVTAESTNDSGFIKTLSATFHFEDSGYYSITDYDHYITVDIYTGANPPNGGKQQFYYKNFVPDASNPVLSNFERPGADVYDTYIVLEAQALKPNTHYELMFFKMKAFDVPMVDKAELVSTIKIN